MVFDMGIVRSISGSSERVTFTVTVEPSAAV